MSKIHSLCNPVARSGEEITDPARYLACYQVAQTPRQTAFQPAGTIDETASWARRR